MDQPLGTSVPGDPNRAVPNYVQGALYDPHWDVPVLSVPGHGGGADLSHKSYSPRTGLIFTGYGYVAAAHSLTEASNGLRPPGEYQTGGVVAVDVSTNRIHWKKRMPYSLAHGNGILTTAADLLFIGQPDGNLLAMDARDGRELWRSRPGRRSVAAQSCTKWTVSSTSRHTQAAPASRTEIPPRAGTFCGRSSSVGECRPRRPRHRR